MEKDHITRYIVLNLNELSVFNILSGSFLAIKKQNIFQLLLSSVLEIVNS